MSLWCMGALHSTAPWLNHGLPIFSFLQFHIWVSLGFALNAAILLSLLQGQLKGQKQATGPFLVKVRDQGA